MLIIMLSVLPLVSLYFNSEPFLLAIRQDAEVRATSAAHGCVAAVADGAVAVAFQASYSARPSFLFSPLSFRRQTSRLVGKFLTISAPILPMVVSFTLMQRTLQVRGSGQRRFFFFCIASGLRPASLSSHPSPPVTRP